MLEISQIRRSAGSANNPRVLRLLTLLTLTGVLAACAQPPKLMYNWETYQPGVYAYLNDDGADYAAQAALFEQNIETARSSDQALPPGFHAHLGMLYLKLGSDDKAVEQLKSEKLSFPEAAPFVDFLLRRFDEPSSEVNESPALPTSATLSIEQQPKGGV